MPTRDGRTWIQVVFHNSATGVVESLDGNLLLGIPNYSAVASRSSGSFHTDTDLPGFFPGLQIEGDWVFTEGSSISGAGMGFSDGHVLVAGSYNVSGNTGLARATVSMTGPVLRVGDLGITRSSSLDFSPTAPAEIEASRVLLWEGTLTIDFSVRLNVAGHYQQYPSSALDLTLGSSTGFAQISVGDQVELAGSLHLRLADGFRTTVGQTYTLINKLSSGALSGTFAGLPDGAVISVGEIQFRINYGLGDGNNDVVLTVIFAPNQAPGGNVQPGQTATIGFWQNQNGQDLIRSLNGGASSTQLGDWLAATFSNLYGASAGANNLAGKTNEEVAALYMSLFERNGQTSPGGPPKLDAQVLATALAVYVTNETLAGTTAAAYGFTVTEHGLGVSTFTVGSSGAAFGVADDTTLTVLDILLATNAQTVNGLLYDLDGSGTISDAERALRELANAVYTAINEQGDR
jgi:hypothetical protein